MKWKNGWDPIWPTIDNDSLQAFGGWRKQQGHCARLRSKAGLSGRAGVVNAPAPPKTIAGFLRGAGFFYPGRYPRTVSQKLDSAAGELMAATRKPMIAPPIWASWLTLPLSERASIMLPTM